MSEFYIKAPTPEELSVTYNGMTFEEFRLLDDDVVWDLRLQAHEQWIEDCKRTDSPEDPESMQAYDKMLLLNNFVYWRRYGVPDRDMTIEEYQKRVRFEIEFRKSKDPEYGKLQKEDIEHLSINEQELAFLLLEVADTSDNEQPVVRVYEDAVERLGVTYDTLVEKGILEAYEVPASPMFASHRRYILAGKFADHAFVNRFLL